MLSVGHSILDQVLQEELQHRAGLLIDGTGDTLHTTTTRQAADGRLCGGRDVGTMAYVAGVHLATQ